MSWLRSALLQLEPEPADEVSNLNRADRAIGSCNDQLRWDRIGEMGRLSSLRG